MFPSVERKSLKLALLAAFAILAMAAPSHASEAKLFCPISPP